MNVLHDNNPSSANCPHCEQYPEDSGPLLSSKRPAAPRLAPGARSMLKHARRQAATRRVAYLHRRPAGRQEVPPGHFLRVWGGPGLTPPPTQGTCTACPSAGSHPSRCIPALQARRQARSTTRSLLLCVGRPRPNPAPDARYMHRMPVGRQPPVALCTCSAGPTAGENSSRRTVFLNHSKAGQPFQTINWAQIRPASPPPRPWMNLMTSYLNYSQAHECSAMDLPRQSHRPRHPASIACI